MDERLARLAAGLGGVFGARDVAALRVPPAALADLVRSGEVVRVRRGAFVLASALASPVTESRPDGSVRERAPLPIDEFALRARAILRSRPARDALSHHASLAVQGIAVYGVDLSVVDIVSACAKPSRREGVDRHPGQGLPIDLVQGVRCVRLPEALVQVAAASGPTAGVCSMDAAVQGGHVTAADLTALAWRLPTRYRTRVLTTLDLLDPACESVGETRTRLLLRDLGFRFRSQVWLEDSAGRIGRVDFLVDDLVVVEFDGLVKYDGIDGKRALAAEKVRESRITDTGREVVRVTWADLDAPKEFAARVRVAKGRAMRRRGTRA